MAVAAHEGGIYVYHLKPMVLICEDIENGAGLQPINEVR